MTRYPVAVIALMVLLAGCGGPEDALAPPAPPPEGEGAAAVQVGPLLVRPAAAAGFVVETIPNPGGAVSLAALYGSRVTYLASQAMLDRIVFARGSGTDYDICVCNLDGSNAVRLLDSTASDLHPRWSPDGTRIAFDRRRGMEDREIVVMNADGSGPVALTNNTSDDVAPDWSPEGRRLVFDSDRTGNVEIFAMFADGTGATNLSQHPSTDQQPTWDPDVYDPHIAFETYRDGNYEIYLMDEDGQSQTPLTNNPAADQYPAYERNGNRIAYQSYVQGGWEVFVVLPFDPPYNLSAAPGDQRHPSWSSDRRFLCYSDNAATDDELTVQQVDPPHDRFTITSNAVHDTCPDLGSPTLQTDRVIIGPSGSDWGGTNPIWSNADAGIVAWAEEGYRSFARIGIRPADLATLRISPLTASAQPMARAVGVLVEAAEVVNVRADGGRGRPPVLWQFDDLDPTAVVIYFDGWSGSVLAALVLRDQSYPAGAGGVGSAVSQRAEGDVTVVEGDFAAVFDATGARTADAAAVVRIAGEVVSVVR